MNRYATGANIPKSPDELEAIFHVDKYSENGDNIASKNSFIKSTSPLNIALKKLENILVRSKLPPY